MLKLWVLNSLFFSSIPPKDNKNFTFGGNCTVLYNYVGDKDFYHAPEYIRYNFPAENIKVDNSFLMGGGGFVQYGPFELSYRSHPIQYRSDMVVLLGKAIDKDILRIMNTKLKILKISIMIGINCGTSSHKNLENPQLSSYINPYIGGKLDIQIGNEYRVGIGGTREHCGRYTILMDLNKDFSGDIDEDIENDIGPYQIPNNTLDNYRESVTL